MAARIRRPNVVVTGFSAFPGVPHNPTEALARTLSGRARAFESRCCLSVHVLPVEYDSLAGQLNAIGRRAAPDIAIHFGLAASARGLRIERMARNICDPDKPDNAGRLPPRVLVPGGPPGLAGTLPADRIEAALTRAGLPALQDDDAGGYVCNALFYLSRSAACGDFRPAMTGLVHVPNIPATEGGPPGNGTRLGLTRLVDGAGLIVRLCVDEWMNRNLSSVSEQFIK